MWLIWLLMLASNQRHLFKRASLDLLTGIDCIISFDNKPNMNSLKTILLRQGSIIGALMHLGAMLSGFISAIILARALGAEGLGVYAATFALLTICSMPLEFGLPSLVTREVAKYWQTDDHSHIRGLLKFSFFSQPLLSLH